MVRFVALLLLVLSRLSGQDGWLLVWGDEFDGTQQSPPNSERWAHDLGAGGWGHNELQTYTNTSENSFLDGNGHLIIVAKQDAALKFTSARLKTQGKFQIAYGRVEARIKLPSGQGVWPAFWLLGSGFPNQPWPECGEIDVLENIGREPSTLHATIHGPGYSGEGGITGAYSLSGGQRLADDFHIFAVDWRVGRIEFSVDGRSYLRLTPSSLPAGRKWVFDSPFFLLLNTAVGGDWPGNPDATTTFPQAMIIDYVRVYRSKAEPIIEPGGVVNGATFSDRLAPGTLASVFGTGLSEVTSSSLFDSGANRFVTRAGDVSINVDGKAAPLIFVSPNQVNFQLPSNAVIGTHSQVVLSRGDSISNSQTLKVSGTAPSLFSQNGHAILTCEPGGLALGSNCTLWGTGFGPKTIPTEDGAPNATATETINRCALTVSGIPAAVTYCGAAPGLIIDQLNFVYPPGIASTNSTISAVLSVGSEQTAFLLRAP